MVRLYLFFQSGVGALFVGLGLLTILAPGGALLLLLGMMMLVVCGAISLAVLSYHGIAWAAHRIAFAWQERWPLRIHVHVPSHLRTLHPLRLVHR